MQGSRRWFDVRAGDKVALLVCMLAARQCARNTMNCVNGGDCGFVTQANSGTNKLNFMALDAKARSIQFCNPKNVCHPERSEGSLLGSCSAWQAVSRRCAARGFVGVRQPAGLAVWRTTVPPVSRLAWAKSEESSRARLGMTGFFCSLLNTVQCGAAEASGGGPREKFG